MEVIREHLATTYFKSLLRKAKIVGEFLDIILESSLRNYGGKDDDHSPQEMIHLSEDLAQIVQFNVNSQKNAKLTFEGRGMRVLTVPFLSTSMA